MSTGSLRLLVLCTGILASPIAHAMIGAWQTNAAASTQQNPTLDKLQEELTARPEWTEGWWKLGTAAYDANRFDIAVPALEHVVQAKKEMGIAWDLLGLSQFGAQQYDNARVSLERAALLHNSDDPEVEHVSAYHLALLRIRDGSFESAASLLRNTFGTSLNAQTSLALGLATLRVPLLPKAVDPSREALLIQIGEAAVRGADGLHDFAGIVDANPSLPALHLAYAKALEDAGQTARAIEEVQRELLIAPQSIAAWSALSSLEKREDQLQAARTADAKVASLKGNESVERAKSQKWFAVRSIDASPEDRNEGMQAYAAGQYAVAAQKLSGWANAHADDGTAWAVLGLSEFEEHQYDNARLHLERGASLGLSGDKSAVGAARFTLGLLLLRSGDFDRASVELGAARRLLGDSERVDIALGFVLLRRASIPTSSGDAIAQDAGKIEGLLLESRYDEAFANFRALLAKYPSTHYVHYNFGNALMALSEFDEASAQMRDEEAITPDSALPYEGLASIALRQHRPSEAVESARLAVARVPNSAEPHYLLGRALLESGANTSDVISQLQQAARLDPNSPEVHYSLAKAYARDSDSAKAEQERAIFTRLSELSDAQNGGQAPRTYEGPREATILSGAPATQNQPQ